MYLCQKHARTGSKRKTSDFDDHQTSVPTEIPKTSVFKRGQDIEDLTPKQKMELMEENFESIEQMKNREDLLQVRTF